jgi:thiamine-phosphate pyrophosphorylase
MVRVSLEATLERSFDGGCRWVVIREKDLDSGERLKLVETILKIAEPYNAKVLVNADMKASTCHKVSPAHMQGRPWARTK